MSGFKFLGCLTPDQLASLLEEIDEGLRKEDLPIQERELHAIGEVARRKGASIPSAPAGTRLGDGTVSDGTADFIKDWYTRRYGDRLKIIFSPGDGIILIRGDAYKFGVPRIFGAVHLVCRPHEIGQKRASVGTEGNLPVANILDAIAGLTSYYALQLTKEELQEIWNTCLSIMDDYQHIENVINALQNTSAERLAREALGDLRDGPDNAFNTQARYGQIRWDALQAVEKMLKAYLALEEIQLRKVHDLNKLISLFGNPLPDIFYDKVKLDKVQCNADVRYAEQSSTLQEAVEAWQTALRMCGELAKRMRSEVGSNR